MAQSEKFPPEISQLLFLLSQAEGSLNEAMDAYDIAFFSLPEWLRKLEDTNRLWRKETNIEEYRNIATPHMLTLWEEYKDRSSVVDKAQQRVTQIEYAIAVFPVKNLDELVAKSKFAKAIFYNTSPSDPDLRDEPRGMDQLVAYYLDQDIQRMAQAYAVTDDRLNRHAKGNV